MSAQLYDNNTIRAFHKEASCLRDQYYQYSVAGESGQTVGTRHHCCIPLSDTQVDGNLTLGENLADHGGLSMALEAYNNWRKHNRDVRLPALPFDDMQLFFIGEYKHHIFTLQWEPC